MTHTAGATSAPPARKPTDDELDVFGLRHTGRVRKTNQERLAFLAVVADGVGGSAAGETASRLAVEVVTRYVAHGMQCYYAAQGEGDDALLSSLTSARQVCQDLLQDALDGGGADNITILVGRTVRKPSPN